MKSQVRLTSIGGRSGAGQSFGYIASQADQLISQDQGFIYAFSPIVTGLSSTRAVVTVIPRVLATVPLSGNYSRSKKEKAPISLGFSSCFASPVFSTGAGTGLQ